MAFLITDIHMTSKDNQFQSDTVMISTLKKNKYAL